MLRLQLDNSPRSPLQILCLGCHSDDIEIGCGGAILRLAAEHPNAEFHWVVLSAIGVRASEAASAARQFISSNQLRKVLLMEFRDGYMPFAGAAVKDVFEELKKDYSPDIVFTHNRYDAHQDHRLAAELTWNTFRDHFILEYEIPKYDGDIGRPNVFFPLSMEECEKKVSVIEGTFRSQAGKRWFQRETFMSLMRLRGVECNAPSGYAEAFFGHKLTL